jgi:hypothetical protein
MERQKGDLAKNGRWERDLTKNRRSKGDLINKKRGRETQNCTMHGDEKEWRKEGRFGKE